MSFTFDDGRAVTDELCDTCGRSYKLVKNFIKRDGDAYAVAFAACHDRGNAHEVWVDVILGSWGGQSDDSDHVTFGARVLPTGAMAVDAAIPYSDSALWGRKLSRAEALAHPLIGEFWSVLDFVLVEDADVRDDMYGPGPIFA